MELTATGLTAARRLVRAHRLWETYLADQVGLSGEQVHDEAEYFEHLLSEELLDEVEITLGYPQLDPHGEPIPAKNGQPDFSLVRLEPGQKALIAGSQISDQATAWLWQYKLLPGEEVILTQQTAEKVAIQVRENTIELPVLLARQINVELPVATPQKSPPTDTGRRDRK